MAPLVSILIPVLNAENFLERCLELILSQTFQDFELLIANDGSRDGTQELIEKYAARDSRIRHIHSVKTGGAGPARNDLLAMAADSKYLFFLEAYNLPHPDKLQRQVEFLESHPEFAAVSSDMNIVDRQGNIIGMYRYPSEYKDILKSATYSIPFAAPGMLLRHNIQEKIGGFSPKRFFSNDVELIYRLMMKYPIASIPEPLMGYCQLEKREYIQDIHRSIWAILRVQCRMLFSRRFFSCKSMFLHFMRYYLLFLPSRLIHWRLSKNHQI